MNNTRRPRRRTHTGHVCKENLARVCGEETNGATKLGVHAGRSPTGGEGWLWASTLAVARTQAAVPTRRRGGHRELAPPHPTNRTPAPTGRAHFPPELRCLAEVPTGHLLPVQSTPPTVSAWLQGVRDTHPGMARPPEDGGPHTTPKAWGPEAEWQGGHASPRRREADSQGPSAPRCLGATPVASSGARHLHIRCPRHWETLLDRGSHLSCDL